MRSFALRAGLFTKISRTARLGVALFLALLLALTLQAQSSKATLPRGDLGVHVNQVSFKGDGQNMLVEIETSTPIVPESQSLGAPDRIVIDFPGALPAAQLRSMQLNYGPLKGIRTGLFSANPPITRVVLDLIGPQPYQIISSENTVTLKFRLPMTAGQNATTTTAASESASGNAMPATSPATQPVPPAPPVTVSFQQGLLQIHAQRATLAEVLFEVQQRTGAEIPIPSGAEQEIVAADIGPASPRDVLAALLAGSRYNFVFIDNERDHSLQKAILTLR